MNIINNEMGDLETGEEITLVLINQWGMPVFRHYVYVKHEMTNMPVGRPGKQCIYLWYKEGKRKRKIKGCCFTENSVAIAKGFQNVVGTLSDGSGEFISFEKGVFDKLKSQLKDIVYCQTEVSYE
jgi:hypothetical protein